MPVFARIRLEASREHAGRLVAPFVAAWRHLPHDLSARVVRRQAPLALWVIASWVVPSSSLLLHRYSFFSLSATHTLHRDPVPSTVWLLPFTR